jgi:hypothetical protein
MEVEEGDSLGESAGETAVEFAMLDMVESVVTVRWKADLGGRAVVAAMLRGREWTISVKERSVQRDQRQQKQLCATVVGQDRLRR